MHCQKANNSDFETKHTLLNIKFKVRTRELGAELWNVFGNYLKEIRFQYS